MVEQTTQDSDQRKIKVKQLQGPELELSVNKDVSNGCPSILTTVLIDPRLRPEEDPRRKEWNPC